MRYVKKQVPVEAFRYAVEKYPEWFNDAVLNGSVNFADGLIYTFDDNVYHFDPGDYIVFEADGDLRPYKADVFEETFKVYEGGKE